MLKIIFTWMLLAGQLVPMNECNEGREMYTLYIQDGDRLRIMEHVYQEEVYLYIRTGVFSYDETYMFDAEKSRNCFGGSD